MGRQHWFLTRHCIPFSMSPILQKRCQVITYSGLYVTSSAGHLGRFQHLTRLAKRYVQACRRDNAHWLHEAGQARYICMSDMPCSLSHWLACNTLQVSLQAICCQNEWLQKKKVHARTHSPSCEALQTQAFVQHLAVLSFFRLASTSALQPSFVLWPVRSCLLDDLV